MTTYPSDYVHAAADARAVHMANRSDRVATHARFTPLTSDFREADTPVGIVARVRVTSRWTGGDSADRCNYTVITVDDQKAGAALLLGHKRWRVETCALIKNNVLGRPAWHYATEYAVRIDAAVEQPYGVELSGWSIPIATGFGDSVWSRDVPAWVTTLDFQRGLAPPEY